MSGLGEQTRPIELPNRRVSRCERVKLVSGHTFFLHCGFDLDGSVREIFIDSKKTSSEMLAMLTDLAVGISYHLQYGMRLTDVICNSDVLRIMINRAIVIERECAAEVIAQYAAAGVVVVA